MPDEAISEERGFTARKKTSLAAEENAGVQLGQSITSNGGRGHPVADGYATSCCKQPTKSRSHISVTSQPVELISVPHTDAHSSAQSLRHNHEDDVVYRSAFHHLHCAGRVDALLSRLRRGRLPRGRRLRLRSHERHVRLLQGLRQWAW